MSVVVSRGINAKWGYAEESTWGTAPDDAGVTYTRFLGGVEVRINENPIPIEEGLGDRDLDAMVKGYRVVDLAVTLRPTSIDLLKYAIDNISKSVAFWGKYEDIGAEIVITGCKANELRLDMAKGALLTAALTFFGKDYSYTGLSSATMGDKPTATPFHFPDEGVQIDGSDAPEINTVSLTVSNNLERIPDWGQTPRAIVERQRVITGEIGGNFENTSLLQKLMNLTKFNMALKISASNTITLTDCYLLSTTLPTRKVDLIALRIPFRARTITIA